MSFSPLYLKRIQRATEKCDADTTYLFPKDEFEVKRNQASIDVNNRELCLVDFKPKGYTVDDWICNETCDLFIDNEYLVDEYERDTGKKFDYQECIDNCKKELKTQEWSSIEFYLDNHEIKEASISIPCDEAEYLTYLIYDPDEKPYELTDKEWDEIKSKWKPLIDECRLEVGALHVHHFVPGIPHDPMAIHDDPPVACFIHPFGCKVEKVLNILYQKD